MSRYFALAFIFSAATVFSTAMGDLAASMKAGEWKTFATNGFSQDLLRTEGFRGGSHSIVSWSGKAQWDPVSEQFFFIGSPHDNPFKFIIYKAETNAWRVGQLPAECMKLGGISGNGCGVHGYYNNAIDPSGENSRVIPPGSKFFYYINERVFQYNIKYDKWSQIPGDTPNNKAYGGLSYFPEANTFVYAAGWPGGWQYDFSTRSWAGISGFSSGTHHLFSIYSSGQKGVFFGGGNTDRTVWKMDASGNVSKTASAPAPIGTNNGHVLVDPVTGNLLLNSNKGSSFHELDVAKNKWGSLPSPPSDIKNAFNDWVAASVSSYGVIMAVTFSPAKVYLYKHSPTPKGISLESPAPFSGFRPAALGKKGVDVFDLRGRRIKNPGAVRSGIYILRSRSSRLVTKKVLLQ